MGRCRRCRPASWRRRLPPVWSIQAYPCFAEWRRPGGRAARRLPHIIARRRQRPCRMGRSSCRGPQQTVRPGVARRPRADRGPRRHLERASHCWRFAGRPERDATRGSSATGGPQADRRSLRRQDDHKEGRIRHRPGPPELSPGNRSQNRGLFVGVGSSAISGSSRSRRPPSNALTLTAPIRRRWHRACAIRRRSHSIRRPVSSMRWSKSAMGSATSSRPTISRVCKRADFTAGPTPISESTRKPASPIVRPIK